MAGPRRLASRLPTAVISLGDSPSPARSESNCSVSSRTSKSPATLSALFSCEANQLRNISTSTLRSVSICDRKLSTIVRSIAPCTAQPSASNNSTAMIGQAHNRRLRNSLVLATVPAILRVAQVMWAAGDDDLDLDEEDW